MKTYKLLSFLLLLTFIACQKEAPIAQPNIIYILADDLGYGDVQCFNEDGKVPTPNIDAMATDGVKFTDAHTSSSVCTPTRYGILTGRYNWRSTLKQGVLSGYSQALIKQERTTVADMLKTQGYSTAFIGKWHLGWDWTLASEAVPQEQANRHVTIDVDYTQAISNGPSTHGFDYSFGFCGSLDMPPYVYVENDMPTMVPTKETVSKGKAMWRLGPTADDFVHDNVLQDLTDRSVAYIKQNANSIKPFFLYFPLPAPHTPILPSEDFRGKSKTNEYGDFVMQVDDVVGQIRLVLKEQGISDNTLLIFTSDNGCSPKADFKELEAVDHDPSYLFRGHKADIYEGGHRVPFVVEWPAGALKNVSVDKSICTTDLFATCAELAEYQILDSQAEDSYSMLPLITGDNDAEIRQYTVHHSIDGSFAIREGDWKLCVCPGSGGWSYPRAQDIKKEKLELPAMQLYNLKADIAECTNLLTENPAKVLELKEALKTIILNGRSTKGDKQNNDTVKSWRQIETIIN